MHLPTRDARLIGYDRAAEIAKEAFHTGKTIREVARARRILPDNELNAILAPWRATHPGIPKKL